MESRFLQYKSSSIHYAVAGHGKQIIVALHGYSDTADSFGFMENALANDFMLIAIEMPFHGQTDWREGLRFPTSDLIEIIQIILDQFPIAEKKIWVMGFSMGGRIALKILQKIPEKISRIILLAPDGLHVNKFYWIATQSFPGRLLFRFTMWYPAWFIFMIRTGKKMGRVGPAGYKFVMSFLVEKEYREELYQRWMAMRKFTPNLEKIKSIIRKFKVDVRMIFGETDHLIQSENGEKFLVGIEKHCKLIVLPCGHNLMQEKNLKGIS
ncbi:MAG TPA: alpha/beta hydrolase, partial [Puia sp.]|nr:alpha/beta hydrolase [Puia sp.]